MMLSVHASPRAQGARVQFQDGYAEVNGVRLHYASVGQGPLVLFLHGYPSFWYQWKDQMAEISRDHLAVGLDMRGYNLSSRAEGIERVWHAVLFYTAGGSKPRDKWHRRVRCKSSPDETRRPSKPGTQRPRALVLRCTSLRKA